MEKIIFFALVLPILGFVFYLGGNAIMKGFKAKEENRPNKPDAQEDEEVSSVNNNDLSGEISKLNELHQNGILNKEEFERAKNKLLNN